MSGLSEQRLDEIAAHVPNCRYGCEACEAFPALAEEVKRLRAENEQLSDLDDVATRRTELQAERDRAVTRWHEEHQRAEKAEAEVRELRALANPATWTTPDGTVLDLSRQIFDRSGDAWQLAEPLPPLTVGMVDGDLDDRTLPQLYARYGPLTNEGEEV